MTKKTVAIIAMGNSYMDFVDVARVDHGRRPCDELWAINAMASVVRCDKAFIMDRIAEDQLPGYLEWLPALAKQIPIYSAHPECIDGLREYPLEAVVNATKSDYFNTTVAYAVGYAIAHADDIGTLKLYGADFTYPDKHIGESGRACVEFHLRQAMGLGMTIEVARHSTLFDMNAGTRLYSYGGKVSIEMQGDRAKVIRKADIVPLQKVG